MRFRERAWVRARATANSRAGDSDLQIIEPARGCLYCDALGDIEEDVRPKPSLLVPWCGGSGLEARGVEESALVEALPGES